MGDCYGNLYGKYTSPMDGMEIWRGFGWYGNFYGDFYDGNFWNGKYT